MEKFRWSKAYLIHVSSTECNEHLLANFADHRFLPPVHRIDRAGCKLNAVSIQEFGVVNRVIRFQINQSCLAEEHHDSQDELKSNDQHRTPDKARMECRAPIPIASSLPNQDD